MESPLNHEVLILFGTEGANPVPRIGEQEGVEVFPLDPANDTTIETVRVTHPALGPFRVDRLSSTPPTQLAGLRTPDNRLRSPSGHRTLEAAKTMLEIQLEGPFDDPMADRKRALQVAALLLGLANEPLGLVDLSTQATWLHRELEDEVSHTAPLDPLCLVAIHAVADPEDPPEARWIHSHGLDEVGLFDFEMHGCGEAFLREFTSFARSLVERILEGSIELDGDPIQIANDLPDLKAVSVDRILSQAPEILQSHHREVRDEHGGRRGVLCDAKDKRALLGLGKLKPQPYTAALAPLPERLMFLRTQTATERHATRARASLHTLQQLMDANTNEADFALAKFGIPTESHGNEHLWVRVDGWTPTEGQGQLLNQPFYVPDLKEGDRVCWQTDQLSDWIFRTTQGDITPQWTVARFEIEAAAGED